MPLHFAETMAGDVTLRDGLPRPLAFTVRAEAEGRGYFCIRGQLALGNTTTPCEGSLTLRPGSIRYRVRFGLDPAAAGLDALLGAAGELRPPGARAPTWLVQGQKTLTPLHPLRSMTTLPVDLCDASGAVHGHGTLRFALSELPAFLRSWFAR